MHQRQQQQQQLENIFFYAIEKLEDFLFYFYFFRTAFRFNLAIGNCISNKKNYY